MARVRLTLHPFRTGIPYHLPWDRSGAAAVLPVYRLYVWLAIAPRDATAADHPADFPDELRPRAVFDTGAPYTMFPHRSWSQFEPAIWWLDQPPTVARRVTVLGGTWGYRLGRVRLGAVDTDRRWLPAVWTNALFLDPDPDAPQEAVLGLRTGLLDRRQFRQDGPAGEDAEPVWWLEDA